jgi:hypothetical protein
MSKQKQALRKLREMMRELFDAGNEGADSHRITRAQGLADGYMRALSDLGVVEEWELMDLIEEERRVVTQKIDSRYSPPIRSQAAAPYPV